MYQPQQQSANVLVYQPSIEEIVYQKTLGMYEKMKNILREFIPLTGENLETNVSSQEIKQNTTSIDYQLEPETSHIFFAKRKSSSHAHPSSNKQKKKKLKEKKRDKFWKGYQGKKR